MEMLDEGAVKWAVLGATIVALEFIGSESLTHACQRALETPVGKVAVPILMGVTVAHLMDWIPHQYDPYYWIADRVPGKDKP